MVGVGNTSIQCRHIGQLTERSARRLTLREEVENTLKRSRITKNNLEAFESILGTP